MDPSGVARPLWNVPAQRRPRVSVIIPAFNLARYLPAAIESALVQDLGAGQVEVIVVDDGSTDDTPRVLERFSDRIRVIRQSNQGLVAAVDRGLAEVRGDYVALLDADDEWPQGRLRRHLAILDASPTVGLVHGDMEIIGPEGETLHPSFFAWKDVKPSDGGVLGRLLNANFVSGGASTFRAVLLPALHPIAPDAAYPDWWIAVCVAAVAEIRHDPAVSNRYRYHGANMGLGAEAGRHAAIYRGELQWRRWMMWHLVDDDTVSVDDVRAALEGWRFGLLAAASGAPGGARELLGGDPQAARAVLEALSVSGPTASPSKALLRALSRDPFDGAIAVDLELALLREAQPAIGSSSPPLIALGECPALTLAWLDEVLARPQLLRAYAQDAHDGKDGTLVVLAARGANLDELITLVDSDPMLRDERCDVRVIYEPTTTPARTWLTARASARLTAGSSAQPYASLPRHGAAIRALAGDYAAA